MSSKSKVFFLGLLFFSLFTHNKTFCMKTLITKMMECFLGFNNETCGQDSTITEEGTKATLKAVELAGKKQNAPAGNATINAFCEHTQKKKKKRKKKKKNWEA